MIKTHPTKKDYSFTFVTPFLHSKVAVAEVLDEFFCTEEEGFRKQDNQKVSLLLFTLFYFSNRFFFSFLPAFQFQTKKTSSLPRQKHIFWVIKLTILSQKLRTNDSLYVDRIQLAKASHILSTYFRFPNKIKVCLLNIWH